MLFTIVKLARCAIKNSFHRQLFSHYKQQNQFQSKHLFEGQSYVVILYNCVSLITEKKKIMKISNVVNENL